MSERYDLLTAREKDGKSYFTKIGVMFPNRSGEGFTCFFEALPIPGPDGCKVIVKKAEPRMTGAGQDNRQRQPAPAFDDDIPY
jgi:hypothetical protein